MKAMHKMLTRPIKRYDNGGGFKYDALGKLFSGATDPIVPVAGVPQDAGFSQSFEPLTGGISTNSGGAAGTSRSARMKDILGGIDSVMPYASNLINSFRTPPKPALPTTDNYVSLQAPSFANDRTEAARNINADTENAARAVDGQTGARIRMYGLSNKLEKFSAINQAEHNARTSVLNEQAKINAGISARNNEKMDQYNRENIERQIALQRERSANIANLSDKYIAIGNEKRKAQVDLDKTKTMSQIFTGSGVSGRLRKLLKESGVPDPTGNEYKDVKAYGGSVQRRSFYRNLQSRAQTLKSLYKAPA